MYKHKKIIFFVGIRSSSFVTTSAWTRIGFFAKYFRSKRCPVQVAGVFSPNSLRKAGSTIVEDIMVFNLCQVIWIHNLFSILFNIFSSLITLVPFFFFQRPKVIVISVPAGEPAVGAYLAARISGAKVIFDYRDEWEDYLMNEAKSKISKVTCKLLKALMSSIYTKSDLVVAVTPNFMASLNDRGVTNVKLVPNGADVETFIPSTHMKNAKGFTMCYSGGIGGYYRLDVVVKALRELTTRAFPEKQLGNIQLTIVGMGEVQKVLKLGQKLGVSNNIKYGGVIENKARLAKLIAESDVGLIPYDDNPLWRNSLPAKFFEYCSCGIPVIATTREDSVLGKLISEYGIGSVVPPLDEEKLAEASYFMYKNKNYRALAGKKARSLIEKKFDRNQIAEDFFKIVAPFL